MIDISPDFLLDNSDSVAFLPPSGEFLAACNLTPNRVTFYRRHGRGEDTRFDVTPCFVMEGNRISGPDGLAFSSDGKWLAVANHGGNSLVVFRRSDPDHDGIPLFDPEPVAVIDDDSLKYCHSVTFTPSRHHLVVTNAGANYINIYPRVTKSLGSGWPATPRQQLLVGSDDTFREVNALNKMEGGPKGIACGSGLLAIGRPETGVTVYPCAETDAGLLLAPGNQFPRESVPLRNKQVQLEECKSGFVVSRLDGGSIFRINASTALVLSMCDGGQTMGQIATDLQDLYPENSNVESDVEYALVQLYNADAISFSPDKSSKS